jgi:hypothetical protein
MNPHWNVTRASTKFGMVHMTAQSQRYGVVLWTAPVEDVGFILGYSRALYSRRVTAEVIKYQTQTPS